MTSDEYEMIAHLAAAIRERPHLLSEWETGFWESFGTKFEEHGKLCFMSVKQKNIVERMAEKYQSVGSKSNPDQSLSEMIGDDEVPF